MEEKKGTNAGVEWMFRGIFGFFQYLRININTLLCNPNLDIVKVFNPIPMEVDILLNYVKFVCFLFVFLKFLH